MNNITECLTKNKPSDTAYSKCFATALGACMEAYSEKPAKDDSRQVLLGLLFVFMYLFLSDVGSIISEKFLKDGATVPFYVQKVALEIGGLPIAFGMSFLIPILQEFLGAKPKYWEHLQWWKPDHSFFIGWDRTVVYGALLVYSIHSWTAGLLVKKLSSVMKLLAKCCSVAGVYFIGDCLWLKKQGFTPPMVCSISAVNVVAGTYTFVQCKPGKDELPKAAAPQRNQDVEMEKKASFYPNQGGA